MNNSANGANKIDVAERSLRLTREVFILVGGVFLIVYFFPALDGLRKRLTAGEIESVSVGGLFSVKLKAEITTFATTSGATNITIDTFSSGDPGIIEKSSSEVLQKVQAQLRAKNGSRIDVITIVPGKQYNGNLLQQYVSLLGARFVIFQASTGLEAWMDASSFAAQVLASRNYDYKQLLEGMVGVSHDFVRKNSTAMAVLDKMQKSHLDNLAVVDDQQRFMFMVSRQDILSKVVTSLVLERQGGSLGNQQAP